jgi:hypothetical protein
MMPKVLKNREAKKKIGAKSCKASSMPEPELLLVFCQRVTGFPGG